MTKLALPLIIILLIGAFVLGMRAKNSFVAPQNENNQATESAQITSEPSPSAASAKPSSASGKSISTAGGNSYTSKETATTVTMSGTFGISTYTNNFTFNIPKNGGEITGTISGTCEGTITGTAEKPNSNNISSISGSYSGNCKPIPTFGFQTPAAGTYTGTVKFNEGVATVIYVNTAPLESRGSFDMNF